MTKKRNIGKEILDGIREIKRAKKGEISLQIIQFPPSPAHEPHLTPDTKEPDTL